MAAFDLPPGAILMLCLPASLNVPNMLSLRMLLSEFNEAGIVCSFLPASDAETPWTSTFTASARATSENASAAKSRHAAVEYRDLRSAFTMLIPLSHHLIGQPLPILD